MAERRGIDPPNCRCAMPDARCQHVVERGPVLKRCGHEECRHSRWETHPSKPVVCWECFYDDVLLRQRGYVYRHAYTPPHGTTGPSLAELARRQTLVGEPVPDYAEIAQRATDRANADSRDPGVGPPSHEARHTPHNF